VAVSSVSPTLHLKNSLARGLTCVYERFRTDHLSLRARSLTYTTLISLVPFSSSPNHADEQRHE
jgi:uncharacterized BrkB/YihY/UPF0761 family membrane protein